MSRASTLRSRNFRLKRKLAEENKFDEGDESTKPSKTTAVLECGPLLNATNASQFLQASGNSSRIELNPDDVSQPEMIDVSLETSYETHANNEIVHDHSVIEDQESIAESALPDKDEITNSGTGENIATDMKRCLKRLALPYSKSDIILKTLHPYHPSLPLCTKTLFGKHEEYDIETLESDNPLDDTAEFVYFGMAEHLKKTVNPKLHPTRILPLQFNMDGVTLFGSSKRELWPILGKVYTKKNHYGPFVIAIHSGKGKPKYVCQYLWKFMEELNVLLQNGIVIDGIHFRVKVMSIVCDTPARAYIKCTKGHTGFSCCERCTVKGFQVDGTTIYPMDEGVLRTDTSFRNQDDENHHKGSSPFLMVRPHLNMIILFVLDFMHLVCLGVTKRLIDQWVPPSAKILGRTELLRLSLRLKNLSDQIPVEFQRTTRTLDDISLWKATEYRFFLLYAGMLALKDVLPKSFYENFLLLSIGCRILCSQDFHKIYIKQAKAHIEKFVRTAAHPSLYGLKILVINVHNLLHLADDVENMGCPLMDYSAFCFENFLGKLKNLIESGNKPLIQLCDKVSDFLESEKAEEKPEFEILREKKVKANEPSNYMRIKLYDCEISLNDVNNVVMLSTGELMRIRSMTSFVKNTKNLKDIIIKGDKIQIIGPAVEYPCNSSLLNMYRVAENDEGIDTMVSSLASVKCKMILLKIFEVATDEKESYAMPLLHMN